MTEGGRGRGGKNEKSGGRTNAVRYTFFSVGARWAGRSAGGRGSGAWGFGVEGLAMRPWCVLGKGRL